MNQNDINEMEWRNPANWTWRGPLGVYGSRRDTRLVVPKAARWMGWTLNTAHPGIYRVLAVIALVPLVFLLAQRLFAAG